MASASEAAPVRPLGPHMSPRHGDAVPSPATPAGVPAKCREPVDESCCCWVRLREGAHPAPAVPEEGGTPSWAPAGKSLLLPVLGCRRPHSYSTAQLPCGALDDRVPASTFSSHCPGLPPPAHAPRAETVGLCLLLGLVVLTGAGGWGAGRCAYLALGGTGSSEPCGNWLPKARILWTPLGPAACGQLPSLE